VGKDQTGVTVYGETNLPDGAIVRAQLFLFDEQGSSPKSVTGSNLTLQEASPLRNVPVKDGRYSARFDLSRYAGGKCTAVLDFCPYVGQPSFISDAFGEKGQRMTGEQVAGKPPFDWGVIRRLDDFAYYLCPVIEYG
jgi:hypothetical protein